MIVINQKNKFQAKIYNFSNKKLTRKINLELNYVKILIKVKKQIKIIKI